MPTYTLISQVTVGSGGSANIEFTSIPQTYTDLELHLSTRISRAGATRTGTSLTFNGSTSGYVGIRFASYDGNNRLSDTSSTSNYNVPQSNGNDATASQFAHTTYYISRYANTGVYKVLSSDSACGNNSTSAWIQDHGAGRWENNSAITSISISSGGYNFSQYSTAYLYGISKD